MTEKELVEAEDALPEISEISENLGKTIVKKIIGTYLIQMESEETTVSENVLAHSLSMSLSIVIISSIKTFEKIYNFEKTTLSIEKINYLIEDIFVKVKGIF